MAINFRSKKDTGPRTNEKITASEVRVISSTGKQLGIISIREALNQAEDEGFDLVEVSPEASPPVCKIIDYGKLKYREQKSKKEAKKKQKTIQVKEIKFRPVIEQGDYEVKVNRIKDFIQQGNKVKISLRYRGREMRHVELGHDLLKRVLTDIEQISSVEQEVQFEGRQLITVVAPKHN